MINKSEINNPYRPLDLASVESFYHEGVIKEIKEKLDPAQETRVIVLQGNPGSGKTSTLRRLAASPRLLGKDYIPVYLDARKYKKVDFEGLLLAIFKDVAGRLKEFGYTLPKPGHRPKRTNDDSSDLLESLLLSLDAELHREVTLLLILDECDALLQVMDGPTVSKIIDTLKQIDRDWANYALVLAGHKKLHQASRAVSFRALMDKIEPITIEEMLAEATIRDLIISPVKGHIAYDEKAVDKIVWLSGKNLYFQQLICHYVFDLLMERQEITCSEAVVEEAVQRLFADERPEFAFAWDNYLSTEARLLVSALADESITVNNGPYYDIKEKTLLDHIFGRDIAGQAQVLQEFDYIYELKKRRFDHYPFKIPLVGLWIQRTHPFIKTVIESIDQIAEKIDFNHLIPVMEKLPAEQLLPFDQQVILDIAGKWTQVKNLAMGKRPVGQGQDFFRVFAEHLSLSIKKETAIQGNASIIDIKSLGIGMLEYAYCFLQDKLELNREDINRVERSLAGLAQEGKQKLALFFYFQPSDSVNRILKKNYLNVIPISTDDIKGIIFSGKPRENFKHIILDRLSLAKVCPYQIVGPETTIFYGRDDIIQSISSAANTSYAVVGARKIGKSSLLLRIKENPPPQTEYIHMDMDMAFSGSGNYHTFLAFLERKIEETLGEKISFGFFSFNKRLHKLPAIIQGLSTDYRRLVFIFDEIDKMIEFDSRHDHHLMSIFRSLSQASACQFVFAGFKDLYDCKRDIGHPLYNFAEEIWLKPLEEEAALALVTEPMESIGVYYNDPEDRKLILYYTACHPNLVQFFCKQLIFQVEQHKDVDQKRTIFRADIEAVYSLAYERFIIDEVYMFFSHLNNLERLILIVLAEKELTSGQKTFSAPEIKGWLSELGISISLEDIHKLLVYFVLRFILAEAGKNRYAFALPVFPAILKERAGSHYKTTLIEEIKANDKKSLSI